MRILKIAATSVIIALTAVLFVAYEADAQVLPAQNQTIFGPYPSGFVVSTSSSPTAKLGGTTTPYFNSFFATNGNIKNLIIDTLNGVLYAVDGVVGTTATTSVSCSGSVTCTGFSVFGSAPITITGSGTGGSGLSTSSPIAGGNVLVYSTTGAGSAYGVATGTVSNGTGISVTAGQSIIGTGLTITNTAPDQTVVINAGDGISVLSAYPNFTILNPFAIATDSSNFSQGNLTYLEQVSGKTKLGGVATTSVTCSGGASCTGFTVIGASPITITAPGTFAYPFTPTSWGVSTSTTFGFLNPSNGIIVAASSTFSGNLFLTSLGQGVLYNGSLGLTRSTATNTPTAVDLTLLGSGATIGSLQINNPFAIATTSGIAQGQLPYYTQTSGKTTIGGVSTTTVSCSGSTSCTSFVAIGASPITISSSAVGSGLATSSPTNGGELLYYSAIGAGSAKSTATTTLGGGSTGLSFSNSPVILGASPSALSGTLVIANGGTGTTTAPSGQLLYGGGAGVYQSVATSSIGATGPITFTGTAGAQVGGTAGTYGCTTAASGVAGCLSNTAFDTFNNKLGSYDAWTHTVPGISATTSYIGIGSSTPRSQLSVSTSTQTAPTIALFTVASTTNATLLTVLGNGNVGVGASTTPYAPLTISQSAGLLTTSFVIDGVTASAGAEMALNRSGAASTEANIDFDTAGAEDWQLGEQNNSTSDFELWDGSDNPVFTVNKTSLDINIGTTSCGNTIELCVWGDATPTDSIFAAMTVSSTTALIVKNNGNVGIGGTTSPAFPLTVLQGAGVNTVGLQIDGVAAGATGGAEMALNRDATAGAEANIDFDTNSAEKWQLGMQNNSTDDFELWDGQDTPVFTINQLTKNVGIGTTTPFSALSVSTSTQSAPTTPLFAVASSTNQTLFNVLGSGNVGVGTTTPGTLFSINGSANFTTGTSTILGNGLLSQRINTTATSTLAGVQVGTGGITIQTLLGCNTTKAVTTDTNGNLLCGTITATASPGGASSTVQYNANGSLGGLNTFIWNGTFASIGSTTANTVNTQLFPGLLTLASSTAPQLALSDGTTAGAWTFRSVGGKLYISTSSPTTYATSTPMTALSIVGGPFGANIGINTPTNPRATLDLYEQNGTGASPSVLFGGNAAGDTDFWQARITDNSGTDNDTFQIGRDTVPGTSPFETIDGLGRFGFGTTTPKWLATFASSTVPQITLTSASATGNFHWTMNNIFGNLFFATSSATTFATSTLSNPNQGFIEFPNNGGCVGCSDIILPGGINLRNGSYVNATSTGTIAANTFTDIYTAPAGRRALVVNALDVSTNSASNAFSSWLKDNGNYYRLSATSSPGASSAGHNIGIILEPGESVAVYESTGSVPQLLTYNIIEFDASVPYFSAKVLAPSNATTTLYTAPSGVSAQMVTCSGLWSNGVSACVGNGGPTATTLNFYAVKSGQIANNFNSLVPITTGGSSVSANSIGFLQITNVGIFTRNSGESLQVVSLNGVSLVGTKSVIWMNVFEH